MGDPPRSSPHQRPFPWFFPAEHPVAWGPLPTPHTDAPCTSFRADGRQGQKCVDHSPCGPLMPRTEGRKTPPTPRPSHCNMRKPFCAASVGQVMRLPLRPITCPTEAHTSVVPIPPQGPLLGLSRSWQQDTETALIMLQGNPGYPPRETEMTTDALS